MRYLLGLDVGGTKCSAVLGTDSGEVLDKRTWPSDAERGPDAMIDDLIANGRAVMGDAEAIGVSIGGPMDARRGVVLGPPNLPGWDDVPLRDRLADAFGLPVSVEHDAAACALAEWHWGSARGLDSVVYLTCGTGFGMGLVLHGKPYHGAGGHSCEIGHATFADDGPTAFGKRGSIEAFCAGASLPKLAAWRFPDRFGDHPPDGPALNRLASRGDRDAQAVLNGWADAVGRVAAGIADTLFPDVILLGSLATYLGDNVVERLHSTFRAEAHPHAVERCRLTTCELGDRLQDCSALAAAQRA